MEIRRTDLSEAEVIALLQFHLKDVAQFSPPNAVHALDRAALLEPQVEMFALWQGATLLAIGALKHHTRFAEIKSMRTHPDALRKGAGRKMLTYLIEVAREKGHTAVRLETGTPKGFAAALSLYESFGFVQCAPFADYEPTEFSRFYCLTLQ